MKTLGLFLLVGCASSSTPLTAPAAPTPHTVPAAPIPSTTAIQMASWSPRDLGPAMAVASTRPERCALRVTAKGVTVDGDPTPIDDAIAMCSQRAAVLVELAEEADPTLWQALDAAFSKAHVPVLMRGARGQPVIEGTHR